MRLSPAFQRGTPPPWTKADEEYLMKHSGQHGDMSMQLIADTLGRTKSAVSKKRSQLLERKRFADYRRENDL